MSRARELIEILGLAPHPEKGHFVRSYEAKLVLPAADLAGHGGPRPVATAIYFLLEAAEGESQLHRLKSDELFHLYEGGPLDVLLLPPEGASGDDARVATLGLDLAAGQRPQLVIPAGTWFATILRPGATHCLWGCTVAPGFHFDDFELADARTGAALAARFPELAAQIARVIPG